MTRATEVARATIARVRRMEALLKDENLLRSAEWLLLPIAKQDIVERRLLALRTYDDIQQPSSFDALGAAKEAGVAIARFYQLVAHWRANGRSPLSLVPHQRLGMERATRLAAEETAAEIRSRIAKMIEVDPLVPTRKVISRLRDSWKGPGDLPSEAAIRVFHERAVRNAKPTPGTLTLNFGAQAQEADVVAERFLETLVIDHVTPRGLVAEEDGTPPSITLAIDLWSGAVVGSGVVAGPPQPRGVLLALKDVERRAATCSIGSGAAVQAVRPRIVMATTFAAEWQRFTEELLSVGYDVVDRRDRRLHQGGPTRRLLGMRLGRLDFERRIDRSRPFEYDPKVTAVQPIDVITRLCGEAVDASIDARTTPSMWEHASPIAASPSLTDYTLVDRLDDPATKPAKRERGGASRSINEGEDLGAVLSATVAASVPAARDVVVRRDADGLWRVSAVVDAADRDAAYVRLASGVMKVTAASRQPIVVEVTGDQRK